jgi:two-component system, chemotaxis family, response regulator Rcp1
MNLAAREDNVLPWSISAPGRIEAESRRLGGVAHFQRGDEVPAGARMYSGAATLPFVDRDADYILVVEDNPADVSLLKQALLEHGVDRQVVVANDGEKAMRFVEWGHKEGIAAPKLIVLDLNLPKRNGREVLEFIRAAGTWNHVPLAVLSSSSAARDRADAERLGASRYIRKPLDLDEFMAIGQALKRLIDG